MQESWLQGAQALDAKKRFWILCTKIINAITTCLYRQMKSNPLCLEQNLDTLLELLRITVVPSLRKENNVAWKFLLCSGWSGSTNTPGLLQAIPPIGFLRKSTAGRIHHLDRNWNLQASGHYVSILQLSFTVSVLSSACNVLYVYVVTLPLPPCSSILFPPLLYQLCRFFKLHLIELARACDEYYRHLIYNHCPSSHIASEIIELIT